MEGRGGVAGVRRKEDCGPNGGTLAAAAGSGGGGMTTAQRRQGVVAVLGVWQAEPAGAKCASCRCPLAVSPVPPRPLAARHCHLALGSPLSPRLGEKSEERRRGEEEREDATRGKKAGSLTDRL
uniref:Uncharacterized protein n=1 Tax=Oryza punctata TaxID=4537 RepID=A0A0E0K094_ORYPU